MHKNECKTLCTFTLKNVQKSLDITLEIVYNIDARLREGRRKYREGKQEGHVKVETDKGD